MDFDTANCTATDKQLKLLLGLTIISFLSGCAIRQSPKDSFVQGYYYSRLFHKKLKHIYVVPMDDSIKIFSAKKLGEGVDTTNAMKLALPSHEKPAGFKNYNFKKASLDFDLQNILFKFRPSVKGFPPQFNNNILNGALYLGRRMDIYKLTYSKSPLGDYNRTTTHYGYSLGIFSGIGASRIDEYVTLNALNIEYDGVVNISGISASMAINKLNFGLNAGVDHLLDKNHKLWIYQGKPWLGLSIGVNLN
jgi:hypothetical protein